ncbi:divalent-cation tolerance protein CutA [Chloroflexota bacterium]
MQYYSIYITVKDEEEARKIGRTLVEERLAACVNIHPIKSIYRWQESIQEEGEVVMFVKTKAELADDVIARVKDLHSYEVPCIVALPIIEGYPDYLQWIKESTR